jgi:hypothetical protein
MSHEHDHGDEHDILHDVARFLQPAPGGVKPAVVASMVG